MHPLLEHVILDEREQRYELCFWARLQRGRLRSRLLHRRLVLCVGSDRQQWVRDMLALVEHLGLDERHGCGELSERAVL
jgi:hypothetical protein